MKLSIRLILGSLFLAGNIQASAPDITAAEYEAQVDIAHEQMVVEYLQSIHAWFTNEKASAELITSRLDIVRDLLRCIRKGSAQFPKILAAMQTTLESLDHPQKQSWLQAVSALLRLANSLPAEVIVKV